MPIELRGRLPGSQVVPKDESSVLSWHAAYHGAPPRERTADPDWLTRTARDYEAAGLDSALIAQNSSWPDVWTLCAWALAATERLKIVAAHRVGLQAPTAAARALATLDRLSKGRAAVHVIMGATDEDQQRDGDFVLKAERYRRGAEYVEVFKKELTSTEPFDYEGEFYQVKGGWSAVKPIQAPYPTLSMTSGSEPGIELGAKHADVFALTAEPLESTAEIMGRVRAAAARQGRTMRFWRDCNFILGPTDEAAWQHAEAISAEFNKAKEDYRKSSGERSAKISERGTRVPQSVGSQRVLAAAEKGLKHDRALYTGVAKITYGYVAAAFVGSPKTAAEAVLDYYDLGIDIFSIGLPVITDQDRELRAELLARLREGAAERDRRGAAHGRVA